MLAGLLLVGFRSLWSRGRVYPEMSWAEYEFPFGAENENENVHVGSGGLRLGEALERRVVGYRSPTTLFHPPIF